MTEMRPGRSCLAIVLAAGEGTRMKSQRPKVLHEIAGRSLLGHALAAVAAAGADAVVVVAGPERPEVAREAEALLPSVRIAMQAERRGTAHAVLAAREVLAAGFDDILVAFADTPLVRPETFGALRGALADGAAVAALGFEARDPTGYGRLVVRDGVLEAIVEHKDANEAQREIRFCNAGLMALDGRHALAILEAIGSDNAQREFYLTDAIATARARGLSTVALEAPESEVQGINDRVQLAGAEAEFQRRKRLEVMAGGATLIAPETVFFSHDTQDRPRCPDRAECRLRPRRQRRGRGGDPRLLASRGRRGRTGRERRPLCAACAPARSFGRRPRSAISSRSRRPRSARAPRSTT